MNTKFNNNKRGGRRPVYTIRGTTLDEETIIRQRSYIEDYVRENSGKKFRKTSLFWSIDKDGVSSFSIEFYG